MNLVFNPSRKVKVVLTSFSIALVFALGVLLGYADVLLLTTSTQSTLGTSLPQDLNYDSVEEVYDLLRSNYDGHLSQEELVEGLKVGLVRALNDPYTEYLNSTQAQQFYRSLEGSFSGIGAQLGLQDGSIIVVAPLEGFPAELAGLRSQDRILAVDGKDITSLSLTEVVTMIRGEGGTDVTLTIYRQAQTEHLDITITRAIIHLPSVKSTIEDGIGIIRVIQFADDTVQLAQVAAQEMLQAEVKGVILDLRSNPGGYLDQAAALSGLWLDANQVVVKIQKADGSSQDQRTTTRGILYGMPTVVLVDEGSASASEIVAGALQDYDVATLVGQPTFGKGSVQTLEELKNQDSVLKLTTAHWLTPAGREVDEVGLVPDVVVDVSQEQLSSDQDLQLEKARLILLERQ